MFTWILLIVPSALTGFICAGFSKHKYAVVAAGAIPWLGLLIAILYTEYTQPYQGGGASLWPIAQLFGGAVVAAVGVLSFRYGKRLLNR